MLPEVWYATRISFPFCASFRRMPPAEIESSSGGGEQEHDDALPPRQLPPPPDLRDQRVKHDPVQRPRRAVPQEQRAQVMLAVVDVVELQDRLGGHPAPAQ